MRHSHSLSFFARSYITSLEENAAEGTKLEFEGGLDIVEDLDKVSQLYAYRLTHQDGKNNPLTWVWEALAGGMS